MKVLFSLILSLFIFSTTVPKAEAVVGLVIKHKTTKVVGGVVSVAGLVSIGTGMVVAQTGSWAGLGYVVFGMYGGAIGLVILDENNGNIQFSELKAETAKNLNVSAAELEIYNSEVDQLNAIKEAIESQLADDPSTEEVDALWAEYKDSISSETLKVAAHVVLNLK